MLRHDTELMCHNALLFNSSGDRAWKEARRFFREATSLFEDRCPRTEPSEWGLAITTAADREDAQRRATKRATAKGAQGTQGTQGDGAAVQGTGAGLAGGAPPAALSSGEGAGCALGAVEGDSSGRRSGRAAAAAAASAAEAAAAEAAAAKPTGVAAAATEPDIDLDDYARKVCVCVRCVSGDNAVWAHPRLVQSSSICAGGGGRHWLPCEMSNTCM